MYCSDNDFCRSLDDDARQRLCIGCRKRLSRAGSLEASGRFVDKTIIVLDGIVASSTHGEASVQERNALHLFSFCMPGRVLFQDALFGIQDNNPSPYVSMECLTDCCIAAFDHEFVRMLYSTNPYFARKVNESAVMIMYDYAKYAGILRAEGMFDKVVLLIRHLVDYQLFLSNNHLAQVLACDRTTVSRAVARVRCELPELWERYVANKHRPIELMAPRV